MGESRVLKQKGIIAIEGEIHSLRLGEGDKVVLTYGGKLAEAKRAHVQHMLNQVFPQHTCIILDNGMRIGVVRETKEPTFERMLRYYWTLWRLRTKARYLRIRIWLATPWGRRKGDKA